MIVEALIDMIFVPLRFLLSLLPDVQWNIQTGFFKGFLETIRVVCFILPMATVISILTLVIAITLFKSIISFIRTIWSLIPFA